MSLADAAHRNALVACSRLDVHLPTTVAGTSARFIANTRKEAMRALDLLGEERAARWLFQDAGPDDVFWDVGAYHGHWSIIAARRGAAAVAFEPNPIARKRVHEHVEMNDTYGDVSVRPVALTSENRTVRIDTERAESGVDPGGDITAIGIRGDDCKVSLPTRLKVDVEGHEIEALRGMPGTLMSVQRVVVEVHDPADEPRVRSLLERTGLVTGDVDTDRTELYITGERYDAEG